MIDPSSNPIAELNSKAHSSKLYNIVQIGTSLVATFTGGMTKTMACFVAGTMILTAGGLVAIENIKAGDKVISTYVYTFETAEKTVVETYIREVPKLVHLTINSELITTTEDHPFYVKEYGFINAGELLVGDKVVNASGETYLVENIYVETTEDPVTVYNFQVEDFHTYYVGESGVLVHNADYTSHGRAQAKARGFSDSKVDDIMNNPSHKVYQCEGKTVYAKKSGGYYDVIITNRKGIVVTCVGGKTKSLPSWNAVTKMLNNNGGYSSLPID